VQFGPRAYVPRNRDRELLRGWQVGGPDATATELHAWYFSSDPFKLKDVWADLDGVWSEHGAGYLYGPDDLRLQGRYGRNGVAMFLECYRERLRRLLAEAIPGMGALGS
jgi:hypothetical protein